MDDRLSEIKAELEQFWVDQDPLAPAGSSTVDDLVAEMDSITACEALERLETLLGIELVPADANLSHRTDPIVSQGWKPQARACGLWMSLVWGADRALGALRFLGSRPLLFPSSHARLGLGR